MKIMMKYKYRETGWNAKLTTDTDNDNDLEVEILNFNPNHLFSIFWTINWIIENVSIYGNRPLYSSFREREIPNVLSIENWLPVQFTGR